MTLITAVEGIDFVVISSDSKGSREDAYGTRVDSTDAEKLIKLNKYVGALISGDAEIGVQLVEEFKSQFKNTDKWGITKTAKEFSKFCKNEISHISDSVLTGDEMFPNIIFILAGLDKNKSKYTPKINILRSRKLFFPGREKEKSAKGKPMIAYYILDQEYKKEFDQTNMCFLVGKVMSETIRIDGDVGGKIKMAVIDKRGFRDIADHLIKNKFTKNKDEYKIEEENENLGKLVKE